MLSIIQAANAACDAVRLPVLQAGRQPAGHRHGAVTLSVVVFAKCAPPIGAALKEAGFELRNGLAVSFQGTLDLWPATGQEQPKATAIDPTGPLT